MLAIEHKTFWELAAVSLDDSLRARAMSHDGVVSVPVELAGDFVSCSKLGKWSDEEESIYDQSTECNDEQLSSCGDSTAESLDTCSPSMPPGMFAAPLAMPPGVHLAAAGRTTLRLLNLPVEMTRDDLVRWLQAQGFLAGMDFDFIFVAMDAAGTQSLGSAIVNMRTAQQAERALRELQGFHAWACGSSDVLEVVWHSSEQGLGRLVERFRNSRVMHLRVADLCKPAIFSEQGRTEFPKPTRRIRFVQLK
jgi:hypothetical protein